MNRISIGTACLGLINNLAGGNSDGGDSAELVDWVLSVGEYFWKSTKQKLSIDEQIPQLEKLGTFQNFLIVDMNDFTTRRRISQISSLMEQLNIYSSNLNNDLERAARLGGINSPDMTPRLYNSIEDQKKEIANCFIQLTDTIYKLYDEKVEALDALKRALES